jgi:hypothetical protein
VNIIQKKEKADMTELNMAKQDTESFIDYHERLINGKINGVYDIDKSEIWELLFNERLSSDESRKRLYGVARTIETIKQENWTSLDHDIIKKIEVERLKLEKEKFKLRDQRREYAKLLRTDARFEVLVEQIEKSVELINKSQPLKKNNVVHNTSRKNEGILLCSDWHSELEIDNFLNKFNRNEFLNRLDKLILKTIEYGKMHDISCLHVFNLGDLINGLIHINMRVLNNELTVTQTMFVAETIADMLSRFANEFESVRFYSVLDNHGRVFSNKEEAISGENFSRFFAWYLKPRLRDFDNIKIIDSADDEIGVTTICDKTVFFTHGHNDKLNTIVGDLALMMKIIPDYIFVAHWHHNIEDEVHGCEIVVNQSLSGADEYSKKIRKTSKPSQKFMIFNDDGRLCTYNIGLR